ADLTSSRLSYCAGREPVERLGLSDRADAAGDALPARLMPEERRDAHRDVPQIRLIVEEHHHARTERRSGRASTLDRERHVELLGRHEYAGGAAEEHRLEPP